MENNEKSEVKEQVKIESRKDKWKKNEKNKEFKQPLDMQDKLCYVGAIFFLIMAFVPTLLRNFDPNYQEGGRIEETPVEQKEINKKLVCNKSFEDIGFNYTAEVISKYTDSKVQHTEIKYIISLDATSGITYEDVVITEFDNISLIQSKGITYQKNIGEFIVQIDYRLDDGLQKNKVLEKHNKILAVQRQNYQNDEYTCYIEED